MRRQEDELRGDETNEFLESLAEKQPIEETEYRIGHLPLSSQCGPSPGLFGSGELSVEEKNSEILARFQVQGDRQALHEITAGGRSGRTPEVQLAGGPDTV